jgi:hypothetical protein
MLPKGAGAPHLPSKPGNCAPKVTRFERSRAACSAIVGYSSCTPEHPVSDQRIIPHRGEFIDALRLLLRGHVLVRASECSWGCMLAGAHLYHSWPTLHAYGLVDEFDNPDGFAGVRYYRISERGRDFAARACMRWHQLHPLQRVAVRLAG